MNSSLFHPEPLPHPTQFHPKAGFGTSWPHVVCVPVLPEAVQWQVSSESCGGQGQVSERDNRQH